MLERLLYESCVCVHEFCFSFLCGTLGCVFVRCKLLRSSVLAPRDILMLEYVLGGKFCMSRVHVSDL